MILDCANLFRKATKVYYVEVGLYWRCMCEMLSVCITSILCTQMRWETVQWRFHVLTTTSFPFFLSTSVGLFQFPSQPRLLIEFLFSLFHYQWSTLVLMNWHSNCIQTIRSVYKNVVNTEYTHTHKYQQQYRHNIRQIWPINFQWLNLHEKFEMNARSSRKCAVTYNLANVKNGVLEMKAAFNANHFCTSPLQTTVYTRSRCEIQLQYETTFPTQWIN